MWGRALVLRIGALAASALRQHVMALDWLRTMDSLGCCKTSKRDDA